MERQELTVMLGMMVVMVVMTLSANMPAPWNYVAVFGSYIGLILYLLLSEKVIQYILATWPALNASLIMPFSTDQPLTQETFLISSRESITKSGNTYMTLVKLPFPYKDPDAGKTREIFIHHYGDWQSRLAFRRGRIRWQGLILNHPMVEHVIMVRDPRGFVSRAKLYPVFHLIATGHDAERYMSEYIRGFANV